MAKYFDENGNEVEAFSKDELEAKKKEHLEAYLKDNPGDAEKAKQLQADLDAANKKLKDLEGAGGSEGQKKRLIEERDAANKKLEEFQGTVTKQISELKDSFFGSAKKKILDKLAGTDAQLRAKIELEYDGFKGEPKNDVEIQERLTRAFTLATGAAPKPGFMDGMAGGGNRGTDVKPGVAAQETDNAKAMRKVFGISDADATKHAPKTS